MTPANAAFPTLRIMGDSSKLQPLFLLSDEPIGSHAQNAFKDDPFARTVAQAALGTTGPFTIGVYGGWGSGKTSALHAARTMIDEDKTWSHVVTVEFNAWRYEREEHPIVPLVATIEREVAAKAVALGKKDPTKHAEQIAWYEKAGIQCRGFLAGWQFKLKPKIGIPFVGKLGVEATWTAKDSLQRYTDLQKELKALDGEHWSTLRDSCLSLSVFDALDAVGAAVGNAAGDKKANWPLVVVFIDDLDRCQADKAFELLENVKLVLCQPGFVFVLALNHAVVDGYLTYRAEKLYGKDKASLHKSYLEKIVQLPLTMPTRSERFTVFAEHLLDTRLSKAADPHLRDGLKKLAKVLALSANRTPRSLVRRINTALIDIALHDPAVLPDSLKRETGACPHFSGLCIVQRTLEAAIGMDFTRALAQDNPLCEAIAKGNIFGIEEAIKTAREVDPARRAADMRPRIPVIGDIRGERAVPVGPEPTMQDPHSVRGLRELFDALYEATFLWWEDQDEAGEHIPGTSVLTSPEGKRWLTQHAERRAIMRITVQRPDADAAAPAADEKPDEGDAPAETHTPKPPAPGTRGRQLTGKERAIIEKSIRQHLKLPANAPLGPAEFARVEELDLYSDPITDAGAAWLADPATGFTALTTLYLGHTWITDAGLVALAAKGSVLGTLKNLDLYKTQITDAGVVALAAKESSLQALTWLRLSGKQITDAGAKALVAPDSGLQALTDLHLFDTMITDVGEQAIISRYPRINLTT